MKDNIVLGGVISTIEYEGWSDLWNGKITIIKKRVKMLKNILKIIDEGEI